MRSRRSAGLLAVLLILVSAFSAWANPTSSTRRATFGVTGLFDNGQSPAQSVLGRDDNRLWTVEKLLIDERAAHSRFLLELTLPVAAMTDSAVYAHGSGAMELSRLGWRRTDGRVTFNLGDFDLKVGQGVLLALGQQSSDDAPPSSFLRGALFEYRKRSLTVRLGAGLVFVDSLDNAYQTRLVDDPEDQVAAVELSVAPVPILRLATYGVVVEPRYLSDGTDSGATRWMGDGAGVRRLGGGALGELSAGGFSLLLEGDIQRFSDFRPLMPVRDKTGSALLAAATYDSGQRLPGVSVSFGVDGVRYRHMVAEGAYRGAGAPVLRPPPLLMHQMPSLLPENLAVPPVGHQSGVRLRGDIKWRHLGMDVSPSLTLMRHLGSGARLFEGEEALGRSVTGWLRVKWARPLAGRQLVLNGGVYQLKRGDTPDGDVMTGVLPRRHIYSFEMAGKLSLPGGWVGMAGAGVAHHRLVDARDTSFMVVGGHVGVKTKGGVVGRLFVDYSDESQLMAARGWWVWGHSLGWSSHLYPRLDASVLGKLAGIPLQTGVSLGARRGGTRCFDGACRLVPDQLLAMVTITLGNEEAPEKR